MTAVAYLTIFCQSCKTIGSSEEGVISYEITYPKPPKSDLTKSMMPSEMELKFKDDKYLTFISFGFGLVKMQYFSDDKKKELYELIAIGKERVASHNTPENIGDLLKITPEHTVTLVEGETKEIAGYDCLKAKVKVGGANPYEFDAYYTMDLPLIDPNWCTPFKGIPGVLMQYQVEQFDVRMEFTAKSVEFIRQDAKEFSVPDDYSIVNRQKMDSVRVQLKELSEE